MYAEPPGQTSRIPPATTDTKWWNLHQPLILDPFTIRMDSLVVECQHQQLKIATNSPDGEGAVVPNNEEHAQLVQHHEVKEVGGDGQDPAKQVDDQFELLILLLVLVFLVPVKDVAVHVAQDCSQVSA